MLKALWMAVAVALSAVVAGCAGGEARPAGEPAREAARPAFLVYETTGRKIMTDAFDREQEVRLSQRIYASDKGLRTETKVNVADKAGAVGMVGILRLDRKLMWQLDPVERTYSEVTFAEAAESVRGVRELLGRRLADEKLSPEQRRGLEVALGRRQPKVEVKVDPETVEVLGRRCRHVSYFEDGQLRIEEWAAEDLVIPCDMSEVRALTGDFSPGLLKELKGRRSFALKFRIVGRLPASGIPRLSEVEVTRLERPEKLDPALFEVPEGYRLAKAVSKTDAKTR